MVDIVTGSAERAKEMGAYCDRRGTWRFRKWVMKPDGTRQRISGTPNVNTKKGAEHAEREAIRRIENPSAAPMPTTPPKEVPTVRDYSEIFLSGYAAAHKPSELASKKQILNAHILKWFGETRVDEIDQAELDQFRAALLKDRKGKNRSRKTVNNITTVLSSLLRYAAKNGARPAVDLDFAIKEDESELVALRPAQVELLLGAAAGDDRYTVAILLGVDAGLRVGEMRGLEWWDIDELKRMVSVAREIDPRNNVTAPKNRRRRSVPVTPRLWEALQALPRQGDNVLATRLATRAREAGGPIGYYAMRDRLHALYVAASVPAPPKPWHCLRHTFCTELARRGVPMHVIAELAGHESLETTRRYVHATEDDRRDAITVLSGANGQPVGNGDRLKG
jgi:integrase